LICARAGKLAAGFSLEVIMSISHWGFFAGVWTTNVPSYSNFGTIVVWEPRDYDELVQWQ